jgi:hypothetical protein
MFDDVHASLVCNGDRRNINEVKIFAGLFRFRHLFFQELIVDRSSPLSGSHEL